MALDKKVSVDLIKYPLLTEKTIKLVEQNKYSFCVDAQATKPLVKEAIEKLFEVKVTSINTSMQGLKKRRVGKFLGETSRYKRAIVTLAPEDSITLFEDT